MPLRSPIPFCSPAGAPPDTLRGWPGPPGKGGEALRGPAPSSRVWALSDVWGPAAEEFAGGRRRLHAFLENPLWVPRTEF